MKYILIMWVCSFVGNNGCLPPVESKKLFDSWYECSVAAQKESIVLLQKMGYAQVNQYQIGTKYSCKLVQVN
jgi:hypothetical protein|tara:strand:+ start:642 stop:857 length:216 start_codon:yes stop_codon:yes gene_type:complete